MQSLFFEEKARIGGFPVDGGEQVCATALVENDQKLEFILFFDL